MLSLNPNIKFFFRQNSKIFLMFYHNVIGQIDGSERADEIILVGAHLDSWDLGG